MKKTSAILTALFTFSSMAMAANPEVLNVYTYDLFSAEWGAGPKIKVAFEKANPQCQVNYVAFDNNATLFQRVRLEGKKTKADVVLGLDSYQIDAATKLDIFAPNGVDLAKLHMPFKWDNQTFLPYDFAQYAFIYDKNKLKNPPKSLKELIENQDLKVLYQDPRTSAIGRGLLVWVNQVYAPNEVENAWKTLAKHTLTVAKGWTESYGAFLKGEGDIVLSTNTSPIYHLLAEKKDNYVAAEFAEGGVLEIEVVAKIKQSKNACAEPFMQFLISPQAQTDIAKDNVMLPVINAPIDPNIDALTAHQWKTRLLDTSKVNGDSLKTWINQWQQALSQ